MSKCPNKAHPDWKELVKKYGENGALKKYIDNNYEIPNSDTSVNPKGEPLSIKKAFGLMSDVFSPKSTLDTIDKHPETFKKIVEGLKKEFPMLNISEGKLFDENGNEKVIPPGKVGMHYRSALVSAIAYSNASFMETVPHEYAHEYIDMFRDVDIVRDAINKYGEERLVTMIGRKYTGQIMSNSFEKFLNNFWKLLRTTFSSPSVIDTLTDSFAKNERLGEPLSRGSEIYNYQDVSPLLTGKENILDYDSTFVKKENKIKTDETVINSIQKILFPTKSDMDSVGVPVRLFDKFILDLENGVDSLTDTKGDTKNNANVDKSLVDYVKMVITSNTDKKIRIISKLKKENIELSAEEQLAYEYILNLRRGVLSEVEIRNSYLQDDKMSEKSTINSFISNEIHTQNSSRDLNRASKNKYTRWAADWLSKGLQHVGNNRLWAKYVSGGENTLFSNLVNKGLLNGRVKFSEYYNKFKDILTIESTELMNGSTFYNKNVSINELDTTKIILDEKINSNVPQKSIQLTKSELLRIYLTERQSGGRLKMMKNGITLNPIKDRDYSLRTILKLNDEQIDNIISEINSSPEMVEIVGKIDEVMKYSHETLNPVHTKLEGYELENIKNYFPLIHGYYDESIPKHKNAIDDVRSFRKRFENSDSPIRIGDVFETLSSVQMSNATYIGYAIPIHNAQLAIDAIKSDSYHSDTNKFIESIQGTIDKIQNPNLLYSTQGEDKTSRMFSKLQSNFAVSVLAYNPSVIFKQQIALETAALLMNRKHIRKAGANIVGINVINPLHLLRQLTLKGNETKIPVEWKQLTENEDFKFLVANSPLIRDRALGMHTIESSGIVMSENINEDKIKIPFAKHKDGSPILITKSRLMMGITIMDTLVTLRLWNAVKFETADRMNEPAFANATKEQIDKHNIERLVELLDKTQPTHDQMTRTGLSRNSNPLIKAVTMFSSSTSKMGMIIVDSIVDYNNNPNPQNFKKLIRTFSNIGISTTIQLAMIDIIWQGLRYGWDDDDFEEIPEKLWIGSLTNTAGSLQGLGTAIGLITSQLDSQPFFRTVQDPVQLIFQEGSSAVANLVKGNYLNFLKNTSNTVLKATGVPIVPVNLGIKGIENLTEN